MDNNNAVQVYINITPEHLIEKAEEYKKSGWGLSQIHCTKTKTRDGGTGELIYTFERDYIIEHLRISMMSTEEDSQCIDSISGIYAYAYIYENEIKDLFGVDIQGINIDFKGNFYKTEIKAPFNIQVKG